MDKIGMDPVWFALADAKHCRLLCGCMTEQGSLHVDEHDTFENTFPEQERQRPQTGGGTTNNVEENERRFAGKIVEMLQESAARHGINRLAVFAGPHMLGIIRKASSELLPGQLAEIDGNLVGFDVGQLERHPMICDMVRAAQA